MTRKANRHLLVLHNFDAILDGTVIEFRVWEDFFDSVHEMNSEHVILKKVDCRISKL